MSRPVRNRAPACSISRPTCRARARRRAGPQGVQAVVQRDPARARARRRSRPTSAAAEHLEDYPDGTARVLREAIGRAFGLDPDRIVCGAGSDELLNLLARAYLGRRRRGDLTPPTASWCTRSRRSAPAPSPWSRRRRTSPPTSMRSSARGDAEDQDRVPRQPEQPDRHLYPVRRGEAPARRPAAACAAGARRGLCRIRRRATTTRSGIELVATTENSVMCRTFSKIYGLAALRLGWMYGPAHVVDAINRIRGPFNVNAPAIAAGVAAIERHRACRDAPRA